MGGQGQLCRKGWFHILCRKRIPRAWSQEFGDGVLRMSLPRMVSFTSWSTLSRSWTSIPKT